MFNYFNRILIWICISQKVSQCIEEDYQWFDQMDDSQLLDIFNETSFDSLMILADVNQRFRKLIVNSIASSKYHINEKRVSISTRSGGASPESIELGDRIIKIFCVASASKFLRVFGSIVSDIMITKDYEFHKGRISWHLNTDKHINEYCSDSLKKLTLHSRVNTTDAWRKPFKQLTNLIVHDKLVEYKQTKFNEIFPSLSSLGVVDRSHNITIVDDLRKLYYFRDYHFPHIKAMRFDGITTNELRFLEMNPQLRSITIPNLLFLNTLGSISEKLPNLEFIDVEIFMPYNVLDRMRNQVVHFENVKSCRIGIVSSRINEASVIPLVFDQLEEMVTTSWYTLDIWTKFMKQHTKLKVLRVLYINGQDLKMIAEEMPNLIELNIYELRNVQDDVITSLLSSPTNLRKITLKTSKSICELFRSSLISAWQIDGECINEYSETILLRKIKF